MKAVKVIIAARVQKALGMGCDGIEPDNMMVRNLPATAVSLTHRSFSLVQNTVPYQVHKNSQAPRGLVVGSTAFQTQKKTDQIYLHFVSRSFGADISRIHMVYTIYNLQYIMFTERDLYGRGRAHVCQSGGICMVRFWQTSRNAKQ